MNIKISLVSLFIALTGISVISAQTIRPAVREVAEAPSDKQNFHLYLLIGQSNMAGRGIAEAQDTIPDARVLRLNKEGKWEIAKDPVHFDKPVAGVGPGLTFGKTMASHDPSVIIGLIPCAVGGSGIDVWKTGEYYKATKTFPYDDAIRRAKEAMRSGILKGIIWHQGESDSSPEKSAAYAAKLKNLIENLRADLDIPGLPFVAGQLPDYQIYKTDSSGAKRINTSALAVNKAIESIKVKNYAFIRAKGTADIGDHTHFNAVSARLMGQRFAEAMIKLTKAIKSK